jgi:hypothetical protein
MVFLGLYGVFIMGIILLVPRPLLEGLIMAERVLQPLNGIRRLGGQTITRWHLKILAMFVAVIVVLIGVQRPPGGGSPVLWLMRIHDGRTMVIVNRGF